MGESTPLPIRAFIPPPQEAPAEEFNIRSPPLSFLSMIKSIIQSPCAAPDPSPFKADYSKASLSFNEKVLANFDYDVEKFINTHSNSVIAHGKQFRPMHVLGPLLHDHPHWKAFK